MTTFENGKYLYLTQFIKGIILDSDLPSDLKFDKTDHYSNTNSLKEFTILKNNLNHPLTSIIIKSINIFKPSWVELLVTDVPYLFNNNFNYLFINSDNDKFYKRVSKL